MVASFPDPEGHFYCLLMLAQLGEWDRAVEILGEVVDRGFFPYDTFARHTWFDPLRDRPDFVAILQNAERHQVEARAAFVQAGGETLLAPPD